MAPDGKIVVTRQSNVVTRLNPNGSLDTTFGAGGHLTVTAGGATPGLSGAAVQPDGKIVMAGWYTTATNTRDAVVLRYNADGTPMPRSGRAAGPA